MKLCYLCNRFVDADHDCKTAKRLNSNPTELDAPFVSTSATPTRAR